MVIVNHRVAEIVVLVAILQHGGLELRALRQAEALGKAARGDVAHDDLQRHDGYLFHHRLAVVKLLYEVGGHAGLFQKLHQIIGHTIVHRALAGDRPLLLAVEGGRVILVRYDAAARIVGRVDLFCLALVKLFPFFHT